MPFVRHNTLCSIAEPLVYSSTRQSAKVLFIVMWLKKAFVYGILILINGQGLFMKNIKQFLEQLKQFAIARNDIQSVIIVGSYARNTFTENSDLDLCIITTNKSDMVSNTQFVSFFGDVVKKQIEYYGACTSIRVWYKSGLEVEFGIVEPSWIKLPLDKGTQKVLNDGYKIVLDKIGCYNNILS